ncbi:MAG: ribonuclease E/G, partial [Opitutus sp.]
MSDPLPSSNPEPAGAPPDLIRKYDEELVNPPPQKETVTVSDAELKAGATERSRQRPLLQKILAVFQKEKGSYRELIINSEPLEKRVALLVDGRLEKFEIERESDNR